MAETIEKLTPAQEKELEVWRERWLGIGLCTDRANRKRAEEAISEMYKIIGFKPPEFVWCESPKKCLEKLSELGGSPEREYLGKEWWGQHEAYWIATYLFCRDVLSVKYEEEKNKYIDLWSEVCQSCCWWWPYEHYCIISERPTACHLNKDGRLHCETGPALAFNDEQCQLYSLNGVIVPKWLVETPAEKIDPKEVTKEKNAEVRREIVRKVGVDRVCHKLGAKVLDTQGEYELLELKVDGNKWKYLKMHNPSVPEVWHVEGVGNECNTVADALHWRKPDKMRAIAVDDKKGEDWVLQGDVHIWPRNAKALKRFPAKIT